jgi:hypothetical protein
MATVETIDFEAVYQDIVSRLKKDEQRRESTPHVQIWNGDWDYVGEVHREIAASFQRLDNETGIGTIELPASYYLAKWLTDSKSRAGHKNVFVTVDYQGMRWSGTLDEVEQKKDNTGYRTVVATFLHDYEHLKHILAYSNPFLPPELQFPRIWVCPPSVMGGGQAGCLKMYSVWAFEMGSKANAFGQSNAPRVFALGFAG